MHSPFSLRLAFRSLTRARGATVIAMITLGIGLSAAVSLLGVADGGTRSLPVPDGKAIAELDISDVRGRHIDPPAPIDAWARGPGVIAAGALQQTQATLAMVGVPAVRAVGAAMHPSVFALLKVQPRLGRIPTNDASDDNAIVLGYDTYTALGGTTAILGSTIRVDGDAHTVIGVMPEGFGFPEKQSFWTVLPAKASGEIVARLAHGASFDEVARAVSQRLDAMHDATFTSRAKGKARVAVQPWTRSRNNGGEGAVFAGLGVLVGLMVLVCAANVATLLLVRASERSGALAIQSALGASRMSIIMQLLAEALLIAIGGGMIGLLGGYAMLRWMQLNLSQHWGYYWMRMELRAPVVLMTFGVIAVTAIVAGISPAIRASRINLAGVMVGAGRGSFDIRKRRLGRGLVGVQVALSTIGLVTAAYLTWGMARLADKTSLLPLDDVGIASIAVPAGRYTDAASRAQLIARLRQEVLRIPGVRTVSLDGAIPGQGGSRAKLTTDSNATSTDPQVGWITADDQMAVTYANRIIAGRNFTSKDDAGAPPVVLVTPAFVRNHLHGQPLGQTIALEGVHAKDNPAEIVGVIADWFPDGGAATDRVIVPTLQAFPEELWLSIGFGRSDAAARGDGGARGDAAARGDASAILSGVRTAVARVDSELAVGDVQTLHAFMAWMFRMSRVIAAFGALGGVASAIIAAIGLYGVIAFQVRAQMREIGVRMAIGAGSSRIMFDVVRESIVRVAPGLIAGMALALAAVPMISRVASAGTRPPSAMLLGTVCIAMLLIGVVAALEPALRAARLDPLVVLRQE